MRLQRMQWVLAVFWGLGGGLAHAATGGTDAAPPARTIDLQEAYRLAAAHSPTLRAAEAAIEQARGYRRQALAAFLPTLGGGLSWQHNEPVTKLEMANFVPDPTSPIGISIGDPPSVSREITKRDALGLQVSLDVPLFVGPAIPAYQNARDQIDVARLQAVRARQGLLFGVAGQFHRALGARRSAAILRVTASLAEEHLKAARARLAAGDSARLLVTRAEIEYDQARENLLQAEAQQDIEERALGVLLGVDGPVAVADVPPQQAPAPAEAALLAEALRTRVDCQAAEAQVKMAERQRAAAYWRFAPVLGGNVTYRRSNQTGFSGENDSWVMGLTLSVPLYDGGKRYGELTAAAAAITAARSQAQACGDTTRSDVLRALGELRAAHAALTVSRHREALARENQTSTQKAYQSGAASSLELLDANTAFAQASLAVMAEELRRDLSWLALDHAVGRFDPLEQPPARAGEPAKE